jgi:hypothetical protein
MGKDHVEAIVGKAAVSDSIALHQLKPPSTPFASPYITFPIEDQNIQLWSDVKPATDEITWSIEAITPSDASLNWDIINVPVDYSLSLEDISTKQVVNLRQDSNLSINAGTHRFILKASKVPIPRATKLLTNYPNPFNPETWIPYELSQDTEVSIRIYTSTGQLVRTLDLGHKPAGFYTTKDKAAYWDGKSEVGEQVASGIYFYSIRAGAFTSTCKMIMLK